MEAKIMAARILWVWYRRSSLRKKEKEICSLAFVLRVVHNATVIPLDLAFG
jgi:hypothetical protein